MRALSISCTVAWFVLASSCSVLEPRDDPTRLYVLATIEELDPERLPAPSVEQSLGIGPVTFPDYLKSELVSREGVTGIESSRFERWAGRLDEGVQRVLRSDLAFLTGAHPVAFPWFSSQAPGSSVRIAFERFELEERARAVLIASWSLADASGAVVSARRSRIVRPLPDAEGATAARELSLALAELCEEIAGAWTPAGSSPGRSPEPPAPR